MTKKKKELDSNACLHCDKTFKTSDSIIFICSANGGVFDDLSTTYPEDSGGIMDYVTVEWDSDKRKLRCFNYHKECWLKIAGEDYTP